MNTMALTGLAASILTAVCMLPQLIKIVREKRAEEISYLMLFTLLAGLALWIVYGILKNDLFIITSNGFSFLINSSVLILSIKYRKSS